jgi:hypothetical protein
VIFINNLSRDNRHPQQQLGLAASSTPSGLIVELLTIEL